MVRVRPYFELDGAGRESLEAMARRLSARFEAGGFRFVDVPVLQPADAYLDMAGEDIRRRIYTIDAEDEGELALRADLTVPLCRRVIGAGGGEAMPLRLAATGACFRSQEEGSGLPTEFLQFGIESFGVTDKAAADLEIFALARGALLDAGCAALTIETGDLALFDLLIAGLDIAPVWRARLARAFRHPSRLPRIVAELSAGAPAPSHDDALATDEDGVAQMLRRLGVDPVGRRSLADIAVRLTEKAEGAKAPRPSPAAMDLVRRLIAVDGPGTEAIAALAQIARAAGGQFAAAAERVSVRTGEIAQTLAPGDTLRFSATLGRKFNYYTGFSFHLWADDLKAPLASGGRYDGLMQHLGARATVPAVGAALWPERILAALGTRP